MNSTPSAHVTTGCGRGVRRRCWRALVLLAMFLLGVCRLPYWWCARESAHWFRGEPDVQQQLARSVERWVSTDLSRADFQTGSTQFDGEWLFGTYLMAGFGFCQIALAHPELRGHYLPLIDRCIVAIQRPDVRALDRDSWGTDPLESLDSADDHAAYLGYFNLLLSLHRTLVADSPHAALNDRISAALLRRMAASPTGILETYPGEAYPVDNAAVLASVALHARATGTERDRILQDAIRQFRRVAIDPASGLLRQAVDKATGAATDAPRGSGTAFGLYFLSFAEPALSADLYAAVKRELWQTVFGFGGVREYLRGTKQQIRDIDSGPIVFGFGLSPTGFLIGGSRIHGDEDAYRRLFATAWACGAPYRHEGQLSFVTGASLGDAILLAMLTARPSDPIYPKFPEAP